MKKAIFILLSALFLSSCFFFYTFKDISISPDVKTYYVENFADNSFGSPATLSQDFSEELRGKVRKETSLKYDDMDPHVTFSGAIQSFSVSSQAPTADGSALNRLEITIRVSYSNAKNEAENWERTFRHYSDFPQDRSLEDEQEKLINEIFNFILDEIINAAFNVW
jgi:hypothetical protein